RGSAALPAPVDPDRADPRDILGKPRQSSLRNGNGSGTQAHTRRGYMSASTSVTGRPAIPAMTTDAERHRYYELAKAAAGKGAIIELGAWLGASTAYIAAGIRDSGVPAKVHVYDKFQS